MAYVYHYHGMLQKSLEVMMHLDGILTCEKKIDSMERYHDVKKVIADDNNADESKLIICSLSVLHKDPELIVDYDGKEVKFKE